MNRKRDVRDLALNRVPSISGLVAPAGGAARLVRQSCEPARRRHDKLSASATEAR